MKISVVAGAWWDVRTKKFDWPRGNKLRWSAEVAVTKTVSGNHGSEWLRLERLWPVMCSEGVFDRFSSVFHLRVISPSAVTAVTVTVISDPEVAAPGGFRLLMRSFHLGV